MAAAVLAAAFLFVWLGLPPRRIQIPAPAASRAATAVAGAFHVHTNSSDGSGSREEVAGAAARAGLQFVVFTDHGDGTRSPRAPEYLSGVLCIDGVEISTEQGHYIAVDMHQTPFPLGGEPRDVVEDVRRFGGFGVVAHPDSAKPELRWDDWNARFDAIEWLNADSEWRDEKRSRLARALIEYPFRPVETLGSLLDRPEQTLARWDSLIQRRPVVALAGADAHARVGRQENEARGYRGGWFLRIPSYEVSFGAFSLHVRLAKPLSRDAAVDARSVLDALRQGHVWSGVDAIAEPASVEFSAEGAQAGGEGDRLTPDAALSLSVRVDAPAGARVVLRKDGQIVADDPASELMLKTIGAAGAYRAEIFLANSPGQPPIPWIVTNPIYVQPMEWGRASGAVPSSAIDRWPVQGGPWHVEKDDASAARVVAGSPSEAAELHFALAASTHTGQYAALGLSTGNALRGHARFAFRASASRPMRISVQARRPSGGQRWQRSIYLDTEPRAIVIPFSDMTPMGQSPRTFEPTAIDTVLFVVDTRNSAPGTSGSFSISEMYVEH